MTPIECTLLSDGSSDRALIPVLEWLLRAHGAYSARGIFRYDPSCFRHPPRSLHERIDHAVEYFPCNLLFIHRDEEGQGRALRESEVRGALARSSFGNRTQAPTVLVLPVRMTEAWLLFDEECIRTAAGCPHGRVALNLPRLRDCEGLVDPKHELHRRLSIATEKRGRHLKRFNLNSAIHRVAELSKDFSPLRRLPAFQSLEDELASVLRENNWG